MRQNPATTRLAGAAMLLLFTACASAGIHRPWVPREAGPEWERVLAAEDARIAAPDDREQLLDALESEHAFIRAMAVRALGRSERADLVPVITPMLNDASDSVRAAAAHALGDVSRRERGDEVRRILLAEVQAQDMADAGTAAMAETLGRLRTDSATATVVARALVPYLEHDDARMGALRGLYFLALQPPARGAVAGAATAAVRALESDESRERALAVTLLALVRGADEATLTRGLDDSDAQVRRSAVAAAGSLADTAAVRRLTRRGMRDAVAAVRYDALRVQVGRLATAGGCATAAEALNDREAHVALLAIDLLGTACRADGNAATLSRIANEAIGADSWHRAARATVALAGIDGRRGANAARRLARHESPFARVYAARAAAAAADTTLLYELAADPDPNVRTAVVAGLSATVGHAADSVYIAQLGSDHSELLMTAAAALEGSSDETASGPLLDALDRVSAHRHETSRDARMALLDRAGELGDRSHSARLQPYLRDFDHAVAERAAAVLENWTGARPQFTPEPLPRLALPAFDEAMRLARSIFVLELSDGSVVRVRLLPFVAPTNAFRFARLARSGYFDGLTFHRVVPNFVVQGGSPGASEYSGDGPFTRDELGAGNWRGTVGLSTRGRDTGDAQFYINLIDNVRLDHEYTVFGVVTGGMDVVDDVMEGAVIRRVREETSR